MKTSDLAPRTSFFATKIKPDTVGVEVGCDCGAHAQALLEYRHVKFLHCIDLFENLWCEGYCTGRLSRWENRVQIIKGSSNAIAKRGGSFDFIYIDIAHDPTTVRESLNDWWPLLKSGGILGYRNYSSCKEGIDPWLVGKVWEVDGYHNEIIIFK